jgi:ABC-type Fe3+/spermidine/putrescine transport system ATPase subunit
MVFQSYAVFPHLTVAENVGYGLRRLSLPTATKHARIDELLALVGLAGFGARHPQALSGGEQQRVAIARALAPKPQVLLLDEPLSALDEKIRREMQTELRNIQKGTATTFVYVTHDQEEALTMSDRIAVLNRGHVVQCDAPARIFRRPRTPFVARFFRGCNVVTLNGMPVAVRAENVRLAELQEEHGRQEDGAILLDAVLQSSTYRGLYTEHQLELADGQRLSAIEQRERELAPGSRVMVAISPADVIPLDPD